MWGTPYFHGFQVSLWVSRGIASGIATGTRKCVISGVCFKWHKILTNSMLQFYSWTMALEKRPWPHKDAFSTYLSTVTIWINIITITITIIISIITIIKFMMRYELVSCIPYYRSTLFNVTISLIYTWRQAILQLPRKTSPLRLLQCRTLTSKDWKVMRPTGRFNHKQSLKKGIATQGPLSLHTVNHMFWVVMADRNWSLSWRLLIIAHIIKGTVGLCFFAFLLLQSASTFHSSVVD